MLVEGDEKSLMTMAAYIDLNPVRAGMVSKPEDYRWRGYASALGGNRWARLGLGKILAQNKKWKPRERAKDGCRLRLRFAVECGI